MTEQPPNPPASTEMAWLLAREAARDLIARYTWAGDRGRSDELAELFSTDGVLDVGEHGGRWIGRDRIRTELAALANNNTGPHPGHVRHHISSTRIEIVSDTEMTSGSYFAVYTRIGLDHWGRYRDRIIHDNNTWRFAERIVQVDGNSPNTLMVHDNP